MRMPRLRDCQHERCSSGCSPVCRVLGGAQNGSPSRTPCDVFYRVQRSSRMTMICVLLMLLVGGSVSGVALSAPAEEVTVFAAAGIGHVIQELIGIYQTEAGQSITFRTNFAASSLLARQIENGAHANIYLSANQQWFDYLEARGMIEGGSGYLLATNALILIGAPQGDVQIERLENLPARLARGNYLAMGDIQHVPVGMYGKEALDHYGLWQAVQKRVAQYPNVRSVTNAVATGQADFGIVYRSELLVAPGVQHLWTFEPATYPPIQFMIGALRGQNTPATRDFLRFLKTSRATAVIRKHGFEP